MEARGRPVSIVESVGSRVTCSAIMASVTLAWTVPAAILALVGGTAISGGLGITGGAATAHGWARATMVVLAMLTFPIGGIWAIRWWPPTVARTRAEWSRLVTVHGSLFAAAAGLAALTTLTSSDDRIWSAAALTGLGGAMVLPRLISRTWSSLSPVTALVALIGYELTIGWLQLLDSSVLGSMLLLAEGLALVWCSVSATRAVLAPPWSITIDADAIDTAVDGERVGSALLNPPVPPPSQARPAVR